MLDVGDTLATALLTNLGPGPGLFVQASEPIGDGPFGNRDVDIYRFESEANGFLVARTTQPPGGESMDTILRLFNAAGTQLAVNDDCLGSLYSCIDAPLVAGATYYIGVSGFPNFGYNPNTGGSGDPGDTGDYRLTLRLTAGPSLVSLTPSRSLFPISSVRVRFDQPVMPGSFTTADINGFSGPVGPVSVTSVTPVAGSTTDFDINFPQQPITGFYDIDIGPNILDLRGNAMDQDADLLAGEGEDRFVGTFGVGGPQVREFDPVFSLANEFIGARIVFDRAMDPSRVTADQLTAWGPSGAIPVVSMTPTDPSNRVFEARVATPQTTLGAYSLFLSADPRDVWNNPLDQDGDFIGGEFPDDHVSRGFRILPQGCFDGDFIYLGCFGVAENIDLEPGQPGVFVIIASGDDAAAPVNLGANTFNFYGTVVTGNNQLFVSTNGLITLGAANTEFSNTDLTASPLQRAIAVLWDDWIKDEVPGNMVLGRFDGDRLIIEWNDVRHFGAGPGTVTFQAILQLNTGEAVGAIRANYIDLDTGEAEFSHGASATVGIKDAGVQGQRRVFLSMNTASVYGSLAVDFTTQTAAPGAAPGGGGGAVTLALAAEEERAAPATSGRLAAQEKDVLDQVFASDEPLLIRTPETGQRTSVTARAAVDTLFDLVLSEF